MVKLLQNSNLLEPQRYRNETGFFVDLIMTSSVSNERKWYMQEPQHTQQTLVLSTTTLTFLIVR